MNLGGPNGWSTGNVVVCDIGSPELNAILCTNIVTMRSRSAVDFRPINFGRKLLFRKIILVKAPKVENYDSVELLVKSFENWPPLIKSQKDAIFLEVWEE